jgi:hypothetical protein
MRKIRQATKLAPLHQWPAEAARLPRLDSMFFGRANVMWSMGYDTADIAESLHVTEASVYNVIERIRKR